MRKHSITELAGPFLLEPLTLPFVSSFFVLAHAVYSGTGASRRAPDAPFEFGLVCPTVSCAAQRITHVSLPCQAQFLSIVYSLDDLFSVWN